MNQADFMSLIAFKTKGDVIAAMTDQQVEDEYRLVQDKAKHKKQQEQVAKILAGMETEGVRQSQEIEVKG